MLCVHVLYNHILTRARRSAVYTAAPQDSLSLAFAASPARPYAPKGAPILVITTTNRESIANNKLINYPDVRC